jgi:hypothetical protein
VIILITLVRRDDTFSKDFTKVPLEKCDYLRDVNEPITIVYCIGWSDGGSLGISFKDSRQIEKAACLENDLDGNRNLTFGTLTPNRDNRVKVGGIEEKAFLGLLQRWRRQDPEAQELHDRIESNPQSGFTDNETDQQRTKAMTIALMRKLLKRN